MTESVTILATTTTNLETYHTRDCQHVTQGDRATRELSREQAEARGLRECKECSGDVERLSEQYKPLRYHV